MQATSKYPLLSGTGQARVFQHWTSLRIVGVGHGRTLWTGQFDSTAMSEPAASGDSIVVLDGSGTLWAVRVTIWVWRESGERGNLIPISTVRPGPFQREIAAARRDKIIDRLREAGLGPDGDPDDNLGGAGHVSPAVPVPEPVRRRLVSTSAGAAGSGSF